MSNNSDPIFEPYAEMDFADAKPVVKVAALAKLQAAHGGTSRIQVIRGLRVIIDVDLAVLYGVPTKRLHEQVKRNRERFPADFLFQLTPQEKTEVVANCDHLQKLKFSKTLPYAFTEHGAIQAANVLLSKQEAI